MRIKLLAIFGWLALTTQAVEDQLRCLLLGGSYSFPVLSGDNKSPAKCKNAKLPIIANSLPELQDICSTLLPHATTRFEKGAGPDTLCDYEIYGNCPENFLHVHGMCYYQSQQPVTYAEAEKVCKTVDAQVLQLNSPQTLRFLRAMDTKIDSTWVQIPEKTKIFTISPLAKNQKRTIAIYPTVDKIVLPGTILNRDAEESFSVICSRRAAADNYIIEKVVQSAKDFNQQCMAIDHRLYCISNNRYSLAAYSNGGSVHKLCSNVMKPFAFDFDAISSAAFPFTEDGFGDSHRQDTTKLYQASGTPFTLSPSYKSVSKRDVHKDCTLVKQEKKFYEFEKHPRVNMDQVTMETAFWEQGSPMQKCPNFDAVIMYSNGGMKIKEAPNSIQAQLMCSAALDPCINPETNDCFKASMCKVVKGKIDCTCPPGTKDLKDKYKYQPGRFCACAGNIELDLLFMIDASENMRNGALKKNIYPFYTNVIKNMDLEDSGVKTKLAIVEYDDLLRVHSFFDSSLKESDAMVIFRHAMRPDGKPRLDAALTYAYDIYTNDFSGVRKDSKKMMVLMSDGKCFGVEDDKSEGYNKGECKNLRQKMEALKNIGVKVLIIGMGDYDVNRLNDIAHDLNSVFPADETLKVSRAMFSWFFKEVCSVY